MGTEWAPSGVRGQGWGDVGEQRNPGGHEADTPGKALGREGPWGSGMGVGR